MMLGTLLHAPLPHAPLRCQKMDMKALAQERMKRRGATTPVAAPTRGAAPPRRVDPLQGCHRSIRLAHSLGGILVCVALLLLLLFSSRTWGVVFALAGVGLGRNGGGWLHGVLPAMWQEGKAPTAAAVAAATGSGIFGLAGVKSPGTALATEWTVALENLAFLCTYGKQNCLTNQATPPRPRPRLPPPPPGLQPGGSLGAVRRSPEMPAASANGGPAVPHQDLARGCPRVGLAALSSAPLLRTHCASSARRPGGSLRAHRRHLTTHLNVSLLPPTLSSGGPRARRCTPARSRWGRSRAWSGASSARGSCSATESPVAPTPGRFAKRQAPPAPAARRSRQWGWGELGACVQLLAAACSLGAAHGGIRAPGRTRPTPPRTTPRWPRGETPPRAG